MASTSYVPELECGLIQCCCWPGSFPESSLPLTRTQQSLLFTSVPYSSLTIGGPKGLVGSGMMIVLRRPSGSDRETGLSPAYWYRMTTCCNKDRGSASLYRALPASYQRWML